MQKVDEAIRQFNLMADAADEIERQYAAGGCQPRSDASAARIGKGQPAYLECGQAGRVAYKGARRAGMSREEASTASAEALAPLKEAKRQQIENFWRDWPATWTLAEVLVPGRGECQSSWRPGGLASIPGKLASPVFRPPPPPCPGHTPYPTHVSLNKPQAECGREFGHRR